MTNKKFWFSILVLLLVFGTTVVGCERSANNNGNGGIFTLTDIPSAYNGKYAQLRAFSNADSNSIGDLRAIDSDISEEFISIAGFERANFSEESVTLVKISDGKVSLPMWVMEGDKFLRYSGNDTFESLNVMIMNTETLSEGSVESEFLTALAFKNITFSKGNAAISFNDGYRISF